MTIARVYYVQDKDTGDFLAPSDAGDCHFVKLLRDAGPFDDFESACETAFIHMGSDFVITPLVVDLESIPLR